MPQTADLSVHLTDAEATGLELVGSIRETARRFRRNRVVVALSGGIDSSVCVGLAARAVGPDRVLAIALPDKESSPESTDLGREVADAFGVPFEVHDITAALDALGCYRDRLEVVRKLEPDFDDGADTFSVEFVPATGEGDRLQSFVLSTVKGGVSSQHRLGGRDFLTIMAATNLKQRIRMLMTYRLADEQNMIAVGTSNRLEIDQGFFVKHGDGCGDVFPLRLLLKTQVYDLARWLGVPESVQQRPPTTDTFSAPQSQEEYFYGTSTEVGDRLWLAWRSSVPVDAVAAQVGLETADVTKFYDLYTRRAGYADYLLTVIRHE